MLKSFDVPVCRAWIEAFVLTKPEEFVRTTWSEPVRSLKFTER